MLNEDIGEPSKCMLCSESIIDYSYNKTRVINSSILINDNGYIFLNRVTSDNRYVFTYVKSLDIVDYSTKKYTAIK